jgi:sulfur carrier protein
MQLTINGEERRVAEVDTVAALLDHLHVSHQAVAVMVNGAIVARERYAEYPVKERDVLEIVRFVGGG